jgi:hypothetical protein
MGLTTVEHRPDPSKVEGERGRRFTEALHLVVLSSFAIAQPVFDLLGRNPTFLVAHRSTLVDILLLTFGLLLVPPLFILLVEYAVALVSDTARKSVHLAAIGLLIALLVCPPLVRRLELPLWAALTALVGVSIGGGFAYRRFAFVRSALTWAAPAPLIFGAMFLAASPVRQLTFPAAVETSGQHTDSETPVVLLVLDELALDGILDVDGDINADRFPNFDRLAEISTWYPNATTVHPQSRVAVTSIFTGTLPENNAVPTSQEHPENLFTLLGDAYQFVGREAVTTLCPPNLCPRSFDPVPAGDRLRSLVVDTTLVYLHTVTPEPIAVSLLPSIDDRWAGFADGGGESSSADLTEQVLTEREEDLWLERFLESLRVPEQPTLFYLHSVLPHAPWRYLPTGQIYENDFFGGVFEDARLGIWEDGEVYTNQGRQRFLLQTKFVDRFLGQVLDKLDELGILEDSLLIVLADHGISFGPGTSRRGLEVGINDDGILPIPLFVKYPGQESGVIDTRPAQTIDVVPTIADVVGLQIPDTIDGSSLIAQHDPTRRPKLVTADGVVDAPEDLFVDSIALARATAGQFGDGSDPYDIYAMGPHRDLVGTPLDDLKVVEGRLPKTATVVGLGRFSDVDPAAPLIPTRVTGTIDGDGHSLEFAMTLNGTVAGVASAFLVAEDNTWNFSFFISPSLMREGCNELGLYVIDPDTESLTAVSVSNNSICSS